MVVARPNLSLHRLIAGEHTRFQSSVEAGMGLDVPAVLHEQPQIPRRSACLSG